MTGFSGKGPKRGKGRLSECRTFPQEVKERLKREISIERLAEARGIKLRRSARNLMGLCPFHNDTHPSLSIDPVKNEWHCFGRVAGAET